MNVILKDKTVLGVDMVRLNTIDNSEDIKIVISLSEADSSKDIRTLKNLLTVDNISEITVESKKGTDKYTFNAMVDVMRIINDYEKRTDIVLEQRIGA